MILPPNRYLQLNGYPQYCIRAQQPGFTPTNLTPKQPETIPPIPPPSILRNTPDLSCKEAEERARALEAERVIAIELVSRDGLQLKNLEKFQSDRTVVLAAVKENGWAFKYADKSLKSDLEFVKEVVKISGFALEYISETLKRNLAIVTAAVAQDGLALGYAHPTCWADQDIVLIAAKTSSAALMFAPEALRDDFGFVLNVVRLRGNALEHATPRLRATEAIVRAAIKNNPNALAYASKTWREKLESDPTVTQQNGSVTHTRL